ncbi:MAG: cell wall-binding repeat-containing protein, partial [Acidimicrobiales bacterium]
MRKTPLWMRRLVVGGVSAATVAGVGLVGLAPVASATPAFSAHRLAGSNRFGTAANIATSSFKTANTVIIANGLSNHLPDS